MSINIRFLTSSTNLLGIRSQKSAEWKVSLGLIMAVLSQTALIWYGQGLIIKQVGLTVNIQPSSER